MQAALPGSGVSLTPCIPRGNAFHISRGIRVATITRICEVDATPRWRVQGVGRAGKWGGDTVTLHTHLHLSWSEPTPELTPPRSPRCQQWGPLHSPSPLGGGARSSTPVGPYIPTGTEALTKGVSTLTEGGLKPQRGSSLTQGGSHTEGSHTEDSALTQSVCTHRGGSAPTWGVCIPQEKSALTQGTPAPTKGHSVLGLSPASRCLGLD